MVIRDMRYMWSAIDSPLLIPNLLQPSRLVVLSSWSMWKNGTGELVKGVGAPPSIFAAASWTLHCWEAGVGMVISAA